MIVDVDEAFAKPIFGHDDNAAGIESRYFKGMKLVEFKTYMCLICGWMYDEAEGIPEDGIPKGTRWQDVPLNWTCPECGARKDDFDMVAI